MSVTLNRIKKRHSINDVNEISSNRGNDEDRNEESNDFNDGGSTECVDGNEVMISTEYNANEITNNRGSEDDGNNDELGELLGDYRRKTFQSSLSESMLSSKQRLPYSQMKACTQQKKRKELLIQIILTANPYEDNVLHNKELYNDTCDLLDDLRVDLALKCGYKVRKDCQDSSSEDDVTDISDTNDDQEDQVKPFAVQLKNHLPSTVYENVVKKMNSLFNANVPSIYKLKKGEKNVSFVPFEMEKDEDEVSTIDSSVREMQNRVRQNLEHVIVDDAHDIEYDFRVPMQRKEDVKEIKNSLMGARIPFNEAVSEYIRHSKLNWGVDFSEESSIGKVACLHCSDGACVSTSNKSESNVLTSSFCIFSKKSINERKLFTSSPNNIMTMMQAQCKESIFYVKQMYRDYFDFCFQNDDFNIFEKSENVEKLEVHDAKFLYILTQHSLWNRSHYPFMSCKCKRGESIDPNHKCEMTCNDEYIRLYELSEQVFREGKNEFGERYTEKVHRDWCDENNYGVTHFGIHPGKFSIESVRFDVFHLRSAITRKLLHYLRQTMDQYDDSTLLQVFKWFRNLWGEWYCVQFILNQTQTRLQGSHIVNFIKRIDDIVGLIKLLVEPDEEFDSFLNALVLWKDISKFLNITEIEDKDEYKCKIEKFEKDVTLFYELGSKSFLTKNDLGDMESFYTHVLRNYIVPIANKTLSDYGCGVGVFTMQAYEHRNKQSKRFMRSRTNNRGNLCMQTIQALFQLFSYGVDW